MKKLSPEARLALVKVAQVALRDMVGLAGVVCVVAGVAQIYVPAAFIIGGALAIAWAFLSARRAD